MLLLGGKTFTVDGVTVFADHADPNQFWYLPAPVGLAMRADEPKEPQFTFIKFRPAAVAQGKGGGFLNFTAALPLRPDTEQAIASQLTRFWPDATDPRLAPVPFDDGTVQCVALDLQGSGGTVGATPRDGVFEAVEKILGATTPSLMGDNDAIFGLSLTQEGATILEQAFDSDMTPIGIIYNLKYTGVRPALDVKITADLKRAYNSFSVGLTAQAYWVSAGIDATFEKLVQDGAIKVEVVNLTTDAENKEKEQWALNLFKDQLLADWFRPSLSPTTAAASLPGATGTGGTVQPRPGLPGGLPGAGGAQGGLPGVNQGGLPGVNHPGLPGVGGGLPGVSHPGLPGVGGALAGTPGLPGAGQANAGLPGAGLPGAGQPGAGLPGAPGVGAPTNPPVHPQTPTVNPAGTPGAGAHPPTAGGGTAGAAGAVAGAAAAAASAASPFGVALRLRYVQQDEQKTLTVEYNRQDAVQRTYAPQGYFGLLLSGIDKSKHFLDVDLDDPFFRVFTVTVTPPRDFAGIGLASLHAALDYGDPADAANAKHGELIFDPQSAAPQKWQVFKDVSGASGYRCQVEYHFDPESGWDGEQLTYALPAKTTEDQDLYLNPHEILGFLEIRVSPGRIDWSAVDYIEADLSYTAQSGWTAAKHLEFRADTKEQLWKLRLADKTDDAFSYRLTHHLKDGTVVPGAAVTTRTPAVVVADPFVGAINLEIQPVLDPAKTRLAFLDVTYRDEAHGYTREENVSLPPNGGAPARLHIPLLDAAQKSYQYRVSLVAAAGGQVTRGDWVTSAETLLFITDSGAR